MKAFVTGSTGLLGNNLISSLVKKGYTVRALARSLAKAAPLAANPGCEVVIGDITDTDRFASQLSGCDVLFHAAAYYREYSQPGQHGSMLKRVNVDATLRLYEAAQRQGVRNIIHVSSNGATGPARKGQRQDESCGYAEQTDNLYFKSKIEAEQAIDRYLSEHPEMRIVLIRPGLMIGPHDSGPTPAGQIVLNLLSRKMPMILPGNIVLVDARDVAEAMIAAVHQGRCGERFIIGGQECSIAAFAHMVENISGVPAPAFSPSYSAAMLLLSVAGMAGRLTGHALPVSPRDLRRMRTLHAPDAAKAASLGVCFRPMEASLRDAIAWFQARN